MAVCTCKIVVLLWYSVPSSTVQSIVTGMQKYALVFKSSSSLLVDSSQVPCKYNDTRNSIEWFCSLDEILRESATLPSSSTVAVYKLRDPTKHTTRFSKIL